MIGILDSPVQQEENLRNETNDEELDEQIEFIENYDFDNVDVNEQ